MTPPLTGQVNVTATATVVQSPATEVVTFTIKAPLTNAAAVFIGPAGVTSTTGYQLDPGDVFEYERSSNAGQPAYNLRLSDFYAVGTTGDKVTWLGSL